jgi:hypothetical protein
MKWIGTWLLLIGLHIAVFAQVSDDISGKWVGFITQEGEANPVASRYHFELDLQPDGTGKWEGSSFSFVKQKGGKRYVLRLQLKAFMQNDTLLLNEIRELEYLNEISQQVSYCLKQMQLIRSSSGGKEYLKGIWQGTEPKRGNRCSPGIIELSRPAINPAEIDTLTSFQQGRAVRLENRKVKSGHKLFFQNNQLTLKIFDEGKQDGDVISLLYNNQWILKNYKLKNEPRIIKVQASPERLNNFLICYANSMGKQAPCTTAVIISDGKKEKKVVLNSDLDTCDIVYFEIED